MYRAYEFKVDPDIQDSLFKGYTKIGQERLDKDAESISELLSEVVKDGTIDGSTLMEKYFPALRKDVFISYSHHDQNLAYSFAGFLQRNFGLTVFIDSLFWGSADKLLKEIDQIYCFQPASNTYNYKKRNITTSHVHAMLTSAIMKAMDQAEIIIFLSTPGAVLQISEAVKNGNNDSTLSPWIYEEVLLTTMLKVTDWSEYRSEQRFDENALMHYDRKMEIAYKLPKEKLIPLTNEQILEWYRLYLERNEGKEPYGGLVARFKKQDKHPLNILYEITCGIDFEA